jgi:hypothetical protein
MLAGTLPVLEEPFCFIVRTRDDVHGHQFANSFRGRGTRFGRGFDGSDIAPNKHRDIPIQQVLFSNQDDVRGLYHGVRSFDSANQTARFNHSKRFHEAANLPESFTKSN